ncbi:hypothetical protein DRH27_05055, partial [Candidatus Falkowbacteria bacterium]
MANPTLSKKSDTTLTVNDNTKRLFQVIYREQNKKEKSNDEIPRIKVSALVSKMAFYYEKIRNSVDYKEEHLHRKNAIERILRRHIIIEGAMSLKGVNSREIASHLLIELIRAAYLENNKIPETKIDEIEEVLNRYLKLKKYSRDAIKPLSVKEKNEFNKWIISLAASDIEERLGRSKVDLLVMDYMYEILTANIKLPKDSSYEKDKEIQIFAGIHRTLLKFDRDMISHLLFKYFNPNWQSLSDEEIARDGKNILGLRGKINKQLDHPLSVQFNRIISRYTVFFTVLVDVISEDPKKVYDNIQRDPKAFPRQIKKICSKKYNTTRTKLWRAALRSIIYIFITKSVFAILLEVPATRWFGEEINIFSLIINISFPAILLFFVVLFTRLPSDANSSKIVQGVEEIVFKEHEREDPFQLRRPVKRKKLMHSVFGLFYAITFFLSFGLFVWILNLIQFSFVSIVIFLFFLAFVSFFSIRIRKNAKEFIILEPKENIFSFILDFFYVPVVSVGKWLSEKFSRINVFVFLLDFII